MTDTTFNHLLQKGVWLLLNTSLKRNTSCLYLYLKEEEKRKRDMKNQFEEQLKEQINCEKVKQRQ